MSRVRQWVRSRFVPGVALIPEDFGKRLTLLKEKAGLSWEGLATCIGVDHRQLLRWRKKGAEPSGGGDAGTGGAGRTGAWRPGYSHGP